MEGKEENAAQPAAQLAVINVTEPPRKQKTYSKVDSWLHWRQQRWRPRELVYHALWPAQLAARRHRVLFLAEPIQ
jgi:hypothetical protein